MPPASAGGFVLGATYIQGCKGKYCDPVVDASIVNAAWAFPFDPGIVFDFVFLIILR